MKVYLAGSINGCTDAECKDWREYVKKLIGVKNCVDPMDRDYRDRELEPAITKQIVENDKLDINSVDCILCIYEKPSVGTSMEILYAWEHKKPVFLVNISEKPLSPWLIYHSSEVFKNIKEACNHFTNNQI